MQKVYCNSCKQTVKCKIKAVNLTTVVNGNEYKYIGEEARCTVCGKIVDVPEINDFNIKSFNDAFQRQTTEMLEHMSNAKAIKEMPQDSYQVFADLLKQHNVTPYQVSKETGITQTALSNWKRKKSTPKLETLWKLSEYFQVTVDYFLNEDENSNSKSAPNAAFERLKLNLMKYDFNESDVDFLIDVYAAHKTQEKNNKRKR